MEKKTDVWNAEKTVSTTFNDNDGNTFNIHGSINCKTVGVIYCTMCEKNVHAGQTGNTLYQCMLLNFSKIQTRKIDDPVANNFCQKEHDIKHFRVLGIDKISGGKVYWEVK